MTKLLVSVKDELEAAIASQFPIDIIDLKDPGQGALGAVQPTLRDRICQQICEPLDSKSSDLSLALGELADWIRLSDSQRRRIFSSELSRFRFVKIGLAQMNHLLDWQTHWSNFMSLLPANTTPVGVAYLDHRLAASPPPDTVLDLLKTQPQAALLLDTFDKSSGNAISICGIEPLSQLVQRAKTSNILTVIAGSLGTQQLNDVLACEPDFIGIRGAVCRDGRSQLDQQKLANFIDAFETAKLITLR